MNDISKVVQLMAEFINGFWYVSDFLGTKKSDSMKSAMNPDEGECDFMVIWTSIASTNKQMVL